MRQTPRRGVKLTKPEFSFLDNLASHPFDARVWRTRWTSCVEESSAQLAQVCCQRRHLRKFETAVRHSGLSKFGDLAAAAIYGGRQDRRGFTHSAAIRQASCSRCCLVSRLFPSRFRRRLANCGLTQRSDVTPSSARRHRCAMIADAARA